MNITFDFATRDDCLDKMVPSDLRQLVAERDRLREALQEINGFASSMDYAYPDGVAYEVERMARTALGEEES